MEHKERYFHECPECGLLTPWVQRKCDCGYQFRQRAPADRRPVIAVFVLSVLLALAVGYILAGGARSSPSVAATPAPTVAPAPTAKPSAKVTATPAPTLRPVLIFNGAIVKDTSLEKLAPLTVEASGSNSYYVYLKCLRLPGDDTGALSRLARAGDISFYVGSGQTADVLVPLGNYEMYYATGSTWYGQEERFGPSTRYYKCDEEFLFSSDASGYAGWTVTLFPVPDGNMGTDKISAADFPE